MVSVSVIIPVYNAQATLKRCMDSVLQQNAAMEVLLIDDGSTDDSGRLCDAYAQQYPQVKAFHTENGGAAKARNFGLEQAAGEFVLFVDSDDYLPANHLECLLAVQQKFDADMVVAGVTYVPGPTVAHRECVCTAQEYLELVLYRDGTGDYPISKLYRRQMFESIRFQEGVTSEDFEVFYRLYRQCRTVAVTDQTTYYYIQASGSVSNGDFSPKFFNRIEICETLLKSVAAEYPALLPAAQSRAVDEAIWLYGLLPGGYPAQRQWIRDTVKKYGKQVLRDPRATAKVKRKVRIFMVCPALWKLRMRAKQLLIRLYNK